MNQLSRVLRSVEGGGLAFRCPGCMETHMIRTGEGPSPRWGWNGNAEKPTFTPSILVSGHKLIRKWHGGWSGEYERDANGNPIPSVCHSFVTDGRIAFLGDCTHALANQTVDLPPVDWV